MNKRRNGDEKKGNGENERETGKRENGKREVRTYPFVALFVSYLANNNYFGIARDGLVAGIRTERTKWRICKESGANVNANDKGTRTRNEMNRETDPADTTQPSSDERTQTRLTRNQNNLRHKGTETATELDHDRRMRLLRGDVGNTPIGERLARRRLSIPLHLHAQHDPRTRTPTVSLSLVAKLQLPDEAERRNSSRRVTATLAAWRERSKHGAAGNEMEWGNEATA